MPATPRTGPAAAPAARARPALLLGIALAFSLACAAAAPFLGLEPVDAGRALADLTGKPRAEWSPDARILALRLPRVLLGWLSGGALAVAGAAMQTLLRNGLATPYTLGVSAAGSFGAFLVFAISGSTSVALLPRASALAFALLDVALVLWIARRTRHGDGLILAGVTLNFLFAAGMMLVRHLARRAELVAMDRWLMGSLDVVGIETALHMLPWMLPGLALVAWRAVALDHLAFDHEVARARGVSVSGVRRDVLVGAGLLAAAVVAHTGPIGFLGLLVPHALRPFTGLRHGLLLPACWLAGSGFLVLADALARSVELVGRASEVPVGIVTALVGAPFFLWLLVRR